MKSAFVVAVVLALASSAFAADCASTPVYTSSLELGCSGSELSYNWPNYKNANQFYACQGVGRPRLLSCSPDTQFSYVLQGCQDCDKYIPSQPCDTLKLEKGSSCQPINGGSTEPTPIYPTETPTTVSTEKTTKTTKPTTEPPIATPTVAPTTKPTPGPATTAFPPAPSPSTVDPNVPIPPTAAPTPPPVEAKPPTVVIPGN